MIKGLKSTIGKLALISTLSSGCYADENQSLENIHATSTDTGTCKGISKEFNDCIANFLSRSQGIINSPDSVQVDKYGRRKIIVESRPESSRCTFSTEKNTDGTCENDRSDENNSYAELVATHENYGEFKKAIVCQYQSFPLHSENNSPYPQYTTTARGLIITDEGCIERYYNTDGEPVFNENNVCQTLSCSELLEQVKGQIEATFLIQENRKDPDFP